jgi:hypothetical protein
MAAKALVPALLVASVAAGSAQVTIHVPTEPVPGQVGPQGERDYGPPRVVDLESINVAPDSYQNAHVVTVGTLDMLSPNQYWTLRDGSATVLLLRADEIGASDLDSLIGSRIEVRGITRALRKKEYVRGVDADLIEHPTLPVLPEPSLGFPRNSITVLAFADRGGRGRSSAQAASAAVMREILETPTEHTGKKVRLRGQFRGNNLFGDLPAASQRSRSDWVLKDGDIALWVSGKPARGKGWSLDPTYKGDAVRWLEVEGKPEVVDGVLYLQASKVMLSSAPAVETADDDPR